MESLDRLVQVKKEILSDYRRRLARGEGVSPETIIQTTESGPSSEHEIAESWVPLAHSRPEQRLAIGLARGEGGNYRLDVRIRRSSGEASRAANLLKEKLSSSEVQIVEDVSAPKRTQRGRGQRFQRLQKFQRPLHIGLSVGRANAGAGTLGVFVELEPDRSDSGVGFLSSLSVLAPGEQPETGDQVYQPGRPDADRLKRSLAIGSIIDFVEVIPTYPNQVDVALVDLSVEAGRGVHQNRVPSGVNCPHEGANIQRVDSDVFSWIGERVGKIGRTTGYTQGIVTAVSMDGITVFNGRQNVVYDDVFEIRSGSRKSPFSAPGDSGGLVFLENRDFSAIGLVFAGGNSEQGPVSYACRLDLALDYLGVRLLREASWHL